MIALVLNYSNLEIRLVFLLESVGGVTVVLAVAAAFRPYLLNRRPPHVRKQRSAVDKTPRTSAQNILALSNVHHVS